MKSYGMTDVGRRRKMNQDYLFYSDEPVGCFPNLYIVADGMGGHKAGDKASTVAVSRFVELAGQMGDDNYISSMEVILKQVNQEIFDLAEKDPELEGMGTTFVAATVDEDGRATIINVGDSRLYIIHEGELSQITLDHSLVEELVRAGELDPELSRSHPQKNIITRALGVSDDLVPDFFIQELKDGDKMLLCSDGLSNMIEDEQIQDILNNARSLDAAAGRCMEEALFYGGLDNITVVIAQYEKRGCK